MALDPDLVRVQYPAMVPMVATLDIAFEHLDATSCSMLLPDNAPYRNHVGGPHAGAMWTLAESASGALVFVSFGDLMADVTPFPIDATIRFLKVAMGPVTATATLGAEAATAVATLESGRRPEFPVEIELSTGTGEDRLVTGSMTVTWTLKLNRR
jgi:acyl-coenzyme A thioesterase PaaI-like protein